MHLSARLKKKGNARLSRARQVNVLNDMKKKSHAKEMY